MMNPMDEGLSAPEAPLGKGPESDRSPSPALREPPSSKRGSNPVPMVQAEKISKLYPVASGFFGKRRFLRAVDEVSLYIRRGETLGLVGESGCGKSTLGRALIRLTEPTAGRLAFDGADLTRLGPTELRAMRRRMQIIFQDPYSSLNPRMTVREIVGEGITIHRLAEGKAHRDELVAAVLERVGLGPETMGRYPHEFSGGQRQRIGIARAVVIKPEFIVCDEPVSALDVSVRAQVINLLEALQDELSLSLLFISHDLRVVSYTAHRMAVMYLGRIVETGRTSDVAEKRLHPYTRALFAAMPGASAHGKRRLLLQGDPPSAIDPPRGCAFHPRCPRSEKGVCDEKTPSLVELDATSQHRVACFHPETSAPIVE